jgi:hypothetical protein
MTKRSPSPGTGQGSDEERAKSRSGDDSDRSAIWLPPTYQQPSTVKPRVGVDDAAQPSSVPRPGYMDTMREWRIASKIGAIIGTVGTIIVIVTGIVTLLDRRAPTDVEALLSDLRVTEQQITLRAFLIDYFDLGVQPSQSNDELRQALQKQGIPSDVSDDVLQTVGIVISYSAAFTGLAGTNCQLEWSLRDWESKSSVGESYLINQPAFPRQTLTPDSRNDRVNEEMWIARPPREGRFYVRLELFDDRPVQTRVRLAMAESPPFS